MGLYSNDLNFLEELPDVEEQMTAPSSPVKPLNFGSRRNVGLASGAAFNISDVGKDTQQNT